MSGSNGKAKATKITQNFFLLEFAEPARHGFPGQGYPLEWIQDRLYPLCRVLEVVRANLGNKPITIVSGFRSPAYNAAVGGARKSRHMQGDACDFVVLGVSPDIVHATCDQLDAEGIVKIPGLGRYPGFTHLDLRPHRARWSGSRTKS